MFSLRLDRTWRGLLALVIAGTIPLSIWGGGCGSQPLVQPDASGQGGGSPATGGVPGTGGLPGAGGVLGSGGVPGTGGHASGGSNGTGGNPPRDASADAVPQCCGSYGATQCSADGRQRRSCGYSPASPQCTLSSGYSYVWLVQDCPNGCVVPDAGSTGTGGGTGAVVGATCR